MIATGAIDRPRRFTPRFAKAKGDQPFAVRECVRRRAVEDVT
jgi:hypothetical protein